jgi:predicted dehydrogenase
MSTVGFACIKGGGTTMAGHIHAISLAQSIFGAGVEAVEAMGPAELSFLHLVYGDGHDELQPEAGVMLNCDSGPTYHCSFYASAFSALGPIHSPQIGDYEFPWGSAAVLRKVQTMVATGQPQAPYAEMLECIAIATAGRLAQERGERVLLAEVTSG